MFKKILLAMGMMVAVSAQASVMENVAFQVSNAMVQSADVRGVFDFKVGDTASYKISMGFLPATMEMVVKAVTADEVTIGQVISMMGQKQDCVQVMNPNTGETKSLTCNGQQQDQGDASNIEVIEQKEDTVKVPAGTFTCLYIKAQQKSDGSTIEQWINPSEIPVFGMAKAITPGQFGQTTIELTSFKKMP